MNGSIVGGPAKAPWHLWVVGILGLLWNGFAAADYTMSQLGSRAWFEAMGFDPQTTTTMLAFLDAAPAWSDAVWALGVWGAVAGTLLLLMRSRLAVIAYAISIVGVIASMVYQATAEYPPALEGMGNSPIMYIVITIAVLLLAYAMRLAKGGVLR